MSGSFEPGSNVTLDGIPDIPNDLVESIKRYGNFRAAEFLAWHPTRLEMLIRTRFANTMQVHRVDGPLGSRQQLTFFDEPVMSVLCYVGDTDGDEWFTFLMDVGGDEFHQVYRFDIAAARTTLLSDGKKKNGAGQYVENLSELYYRRVDADADGAFTEIWRVNPKNPADTSRVATMPGGGWQIADVTPDGGRILCMEYISVSHSRLWIVDSSCGEMERLVPIDEDVHCSLSVPRFAADQQKIYYLSNEASEFRQLFRLDLTTQQATRIGADIDWDIEGLALSRDGRWLAHGSNEAGLSHLHVLDLETLSEVELPEMPDGVMTHLYWHSNSQHLAVTLTSNRIPMDVFVLDMESRQLTRWTHSETGIDTTDFPAAELVTWTSFADLEVTGFLMKPPARYTGKRPVIVRIHGGPESQARPIYQGLWNYYVNELGIAVILPNVRGSTGFGKTFVDLDNGLLREGSYKDIGALLHWIRDQEDLDEDRVMIHGGSYGGHMVLVAATRYDDMIRCSVDLFGISNLRSLLENTSGYRRDLRRIEYGDERDPQIRAWMESSAPINHVGEINKPMLVQQGENDPRVPQSESDQIVGALKERNVPCWYLLFSDEGHGFQKKANSDFAFYVTVRFANQYLLN